MDNRKVAKLVVRHRTFFLLLPLVLAFGVGLPLALHLRIESASSVFFPTDHPFVSVQHRLKRIFGGLNQVSIVVRARNGTILDPEVLETVRKLTESFALSDNVNPRRVVSIASRKIKTIEITKDGFNSDKLLPRIPETEAEMKVLRRNIEHNPLVYGPMVSHDFHDTLIQVDFKDNLSSDQIFEEVQKTLASEKNPAVEFFYSGRPILEGWIDTYLPSIFTIFLVTCAGMALLLWFAFRQFRGVLMPLSSGLMAALIALGAVSLLSWPLDPITTIVSFLLMILGLSHAVQFVRRYLEESRTEADRKVVAERVLVGLLPAVRASLFTDFLGFASLLLIPIGIARVTAILGMIGVAALWITTVTFLTALIAFMPRPVKDVPRPFNFVLKPFVRIATRKISFVPVMSVFLILALVALFGVSRISVGEIEAGSSILSADSPYNTAEREINRSFGGANPYYILVEGEKRNTLKRSDVLTAMDKLETYLRRNIPAVGYAISMADYVKLMNLVWVGPDMRNFVVPPKDKTVGEYLLLLSFSSFPDDFAHLIDNDYRCANIKLDLKDCRGETLRRVVRETKKYLKENPPPPGVEFLFAGGPAGLLAATNDVVSKGLLLNLLFLSLLVYVRIAAALRSFLGGAILYLPLVFSILVTFGVFGLARIPFTVETLPVAAMGVGLGIDYCIYVAVRIREETLKSGLSAGVEKAIMSSGQAVLFTGFVVAAGVLSWLFSPIKYQAKLGAALGALLTVNMLSSLILVPLFFVWLEPRFIRKPIPPSSIDMETPEEVSDVEALV